MTDPTMKRQGWHKLMTPKSSQPSKKALLAGAKAQDEWERKTAEAAEWVAKKFK